MENKDTNDLFFLCSLIEYIARKTSNTKKYIVNQIGKERLNKIYSLADVYHSENMDKTLDELKRECSIKPGNYILNLNNDKPTFWEMGRVYTNLIIGISPNKDNYIDTLIKVYNSFISEKLDDYSSSLYYENPSYILECYKEGRIL